MSKSMKRVHTFHADAFALGGIMRRPYEGNIPAQATLTLPSSGGSAFSHSKDFRFEGGLFSFSHACSNVTGSYDRDAQSWTTLASNSIVGLNILNVLTADLVVSQIATEHPAVGYEPTITFLGTQFKNLQIAGRPVDVALDLDICGASREFPKEPTLQRKTFLDKVAAHQKRLIGGLQNATASRDRYQWDNPEKQRDESGHLLCSLVTQLGGNLPGFSYGHVIELPGFGRVSLAELVVDRNSYQLTMIRLELGSPYETTASVSGSRANGTTAP